MATALAFAVQAAINVRSPAGARQQTATTTAGGYCMASGGRPSQPASGWPTDRGNSWQTPTRHRTGIRPISSVWQNDRLQTSIPAGNRSWTVAARWWATNCYSDMSRTT
ncbi:unnamed protein product (plasmid) [Mycetohabitans rhizoxinica HKI 454]|uniref:Uncharacterized protein n=1 Tax=Mycetohabitans rhizoxinica (strain DSM 19002 / CIP 109453 / HKI 454) TaxID=882378 RepID=E5AV04_MYCRK|nr:unnamed protein product [Mycetohabitans rhizoxinica HKI 454]